MKPTLFVGTSKGMLAFPNIANKYPTHRMSFRNLAMNFQGAVLKIIVPLSVLTDM